MRSRSTGPFFSTVRVFWLGCLLFLWALWLASVPQFLQRAEIGALPTDVVNGLAAAEAAASGAAALGITVANWARISVTVAGFSCLVFTLVAWLVWWRVRTGFGLLTAYVLLLGGSAFMGTAIYGAELSAAAVTAWEVGGLVWPLFFAWLYLFPDGRPVPRRAVWVLGPLLGLFALLFLLNLATKLPVTDPAVAALVSGLQPLFEGLIFPLLLIVGVAQLFRYVRVSNGTQRKQTRWFLFGLVVAFVPLMVLGLVIAYPAELDTIAFTALPIGIGVSVLRYRLWDIDVIIRKTLVYGVLTGLLSLVYAGSVILLQQLFEAVSGQGSPLAVVLSTLLAAALFAPLRRRVQDAVDRRFFRRKVDAAAALAAFAAAARDETDLEALVARLVTVTQETMQPDRASLWLKAIRNPGRRSAR